MSIPGTISKTTVFRTSDGKEHPTWDAARRHLTAVDIAEWLQTMGMPKEHCMTAAEQFLKRYRVSKRGKQ